MLDETNGEGAGAAGDAPHPLSEAIGKTIVRVLLHKEEHGNDQWSSTEIWMMVEFSNGFALYFDGTDRGSDGLWEGSDGLWDADSFYIGWTLPEALDEEWKQGMESKYSFVPESSKESLAAYLGYEYQYTDDIPSDDPYFTSGHQPKPSIGCYGWQWEEDCEFEDLIHGQTVVRIGQDANGSNDVELSNGVVIRTPNGHMASEYAPDCRRTHGGRLTYFQIRKDTEMYSKMSEDEQEQFSQPWWVRAVDEAKEKSSQNDARRRQIPSAAEQCVAR